jgi:hypothetical protein
MRMVMMTSSVVMLGLAIPAAAQSNRELRRAANAAIISDISKDRQAERDANRQPYVSPGYGNISSAKAAGAACAAKARQEAGPGAAIIGRSRTSSMSTGWEVEGEVGPYRDLQSVPFVCSVRNGSVSGILIDPDR